MVRLACISLPRIDLQIVALRHPEWKQLPATVVTEEKPLGRITAANRAAIRHGLSQHGDVDGQRGGPTGRIAAHDRAVELISHGRHAFVERLDLIERHGLG